MIKKIKIMLTAVLLLAGGTGLAAAQNSAKGEDDYNTRVIQLEMTQSDIVVDALASAGQTIKVKRGSVVEFQFSMLYRAEKLWWFGGISPAPKDFFMLIDFDGPPIVNGRVQLNQPGTLLNKYTAMTPGTYTLTFKYGDRAKDAFAQNKQPVEKSITITIEVD